MQGHGMFLLWSGPIVCPAARTMWHPEVFVSGEHSRQVANVGLDAAPRFLSVLCKVIEVWIFSFAAVATAA